MREAASALVHATVDAAALLEGPETPLGALDVPVDLPAPDAPAAAALVLNVSPDVLQRIVQEYADLGGHRGAQRETGSELCDHSNRGAWLVAVSRHELRYIRIGEQGVQHPRAVDVHQDGGGLGADDRDLDAARPELQLQIGQLIANTMKVGPHSEHAPALQTRQSRRTVADDAAPQIGHGGFRLPRACL